MRAEARTESDTSSLKILREVEKGLGGLSRGLSGINDNFTSYLSEMPEDVLVFINEKVLAKKYQDLSQATNLARELSGFKLTKKAIWLPWRKKKVRSRYPVLYKTGPLVPYIHQKPSTSLLEVFRWFHGSPKSEDKNRIALKIQSRKNYLQSLGRSHPALVDLITEDILKDIFNYSRALQEARQKHLEKNPIEKLVLDPRKHAQEIVRNMQREYISLLEKKYLKQLRDFRKKIEKALDETTNPVLNRRLRIVLLRINKIQQILFSVINRYSAELLRV